ncbi:DNA polymerase kappa [Protopterus annectens]|uniref:DNA polymerase kappa n=1 Tax=Protopterus annectens TaxID=7888 RepID=UPI001CFAC9C5|nr:DNA polymerase kappa [Protopterus annectens]
MDKGSRFYENELKKDQQVNHRIEKMMQQRAQLTDHQLMKSTLKVDKLVCELEKGCDLSRTVVHIDMDAFYAAVEMRDNPDLKDKPMAVGSMSMLSTSNYHARKYGVRAAMPGFIGKKLCPSLIIVSPNFDKYRAVSKQVQEILLTYDPSFLPMSLDEAYLDITEHLEERKCWPEDKRTHYTIPNMSARSDVGVEETETTEQLQQNKREETCSPVLFEDSSSPLHPQEIIQNNVVPHKEWTDLPSQNIVVFGVSAEEAVREIRFLIEKKTTLTASAGIAPNMMLAKVCSDKNKPNGQYRIPPDREAVMNFIRDLPIRKVPGIGKVTEKMLKSLGITTCRELFQQRALLSLLFSETSWLHFLNISLGLSSTRLERDSERKSMSTERTFSEVSEPEEQYSLCQELCRDLAQDLQKEGLEGRTVTIKLKNVNFEVKTRASTVLSAVSTEEEIFAVAKELLKTEIDNLFPQPLRLRLMGVRVSSFLNEETKKFHQISIINFFHNGKQEAASCTPALESQKPIVSKTAENSSRESFFNQKRAAREKRIVSTFSEMVTASKQKPEQQSSSLFPDIPKNERIAEAMGETQSKQYFDIPQGFICPVCFTKQKTDHLGVFNQHIDKCLGNSTSKGQTELQESQKTELKLNIRETEAESRSCTNSFMDTNGCYTAHIKQGAELDCIEQEEDVLTESVVNVTCQVSEKASNKIGATTLHKSMEVNSLNTHIDFWKQPASVDSSVLSDVHSAEYHSTRKGTVNDINNTNAFRTAANISVCSVNEEVPLEDVHHQNSKTEKTLSEEISCSINERDSKIQYFGSKAKSDCSTTSKGTAFVCPVCNMKQNTCDLALFNRHVDICLNRDVIHTLTDKRVSAGSSGMTTNKLQKASSVARNKRCGPTAQLPLSKKNRTNTTDKKHRHTNTIDKFFK